MNLCTINLRLINRVVANNQELYADLRAYRKVVGPDASSGSDSESDERPDVDFHGLAGGDMEEVRINS